MQPDRLLEDERLRQQHIDKIEVLERIKNLFFLPKTEAMTTTMAARFYEVDRKTVQKVIERHGQELADNGAYIEDYSSLKEKFGGDKLSPALRKEYGINTKGTVLFPKRALLNLGMLIQTSEIAQRVRTALLDIEEGADDELRVRELTREQELQLDVLNAKEGVEHTLALKRLTEYYDRYKQSYEQFLGFKGSMTMAKYAKMLNIRGLGRNKLFELLRNLGYLRENNEPYQQYVDQGLFEVRATKFYKGTEEVMHSQTLVTPKGADRIFDRLRKEGLA